MTQVMKEIASDVHDGCPPKGAGAAHKHQRHSDGRHVLGPALPFWSPLSGNAICGAAQARQVAIENLAKNDTEGLIAD